MDQHPAPGNIWAPTYSFTVDMVPSVRSGPGPVLVEWGLHGSGKCSEDIAEGLDAKGPEVMGEVGLLFSSPSQCHPAKGTFIQT